MTPPEQPRFTKSKDGKVLSKVRVHLIFWGAQWRTVQDDQDVMSEVTAAAKIIVSPKYLSELSQYNGNKPIDAVLCEPAPVDLHDLPSPYFTKAAAVAEIKRLIDEKSVPQPDDPAYRDKDLLYIVVMPRGVEVDDKTAGDDERLAGGHSYFTHKNRTLYYGWVLSGPQSESVERITSVLSEEVVEAITDPQPGTGWIAKDKEELCDVCEGINTRLTDGKNRFVLVRTYYSNSENDCVP